MIQTINFSLEQKFVHSVYQNRHNKSTSVLRLTNIQLLYELNTIANKINFAKL